MIDAGIALKGETRMTLNWEDLPDADDPVAQFAQLMRDFRYTNVWYTVDEDTLASTVAVKTKIPCITSLPQVDRQFSFRTDAMDALLYSLSFAVKSPASSVYFIPGGIS